ncbi:MAG TPA: hypothetical protein VFZ77_11215 [Acidimicrobiales bacterium]
MSSRNAKHTGSGGRGRDAQLSLIERPRAWRLDEHTREIGRAGVARARAALRAGRQAQATDAPRSGRTAA